MFMKPWLTLAASLSLPFSGICQQIGTTTTREEAEIKKLISQLAIADQNPDFRSILENAGFEFLNKTETKIEKERMIETRRTDCRAAFERLSAYKEKAIPFLVDHLNDDRQSVHFRNHFTGSSVGHACFWNMYYQFQDRPENYSSYGLSRKGRDGKQHVKPYWEDSPFGEDGIKQWLQQNAHLSYPQKQIKCLTWLLEKEKAIGTCDAESYFENILPLEIRILERRLETGEKVEAELEKQRQALKDKSPAAVPPELLPAGNKP